MASINKKYKLAILTNERPDDFKLWETACKNKADQIEFQVIDLTSDNWFEQFESQDVDYLLTKPSCQTNPFKQLYDERLTVLINELNLKAFPTLEEVLIYENKRYFSFWLKANKVPHPATEVFYDQKAAIAFLSRSEFPLVAKLNIGASGHGIEVLRDKSEAEKYINQIFTSGSTSKTGPNISKGKLLNRLFNKLMNPRQLMNRLKVYSAIAADVQKGYVIFQEYIPHEFEWRVVRIGDSFFAHKKLVKKDKASGSLLKGYENPPLDLLDFVKRITDKFNFYSQAVDIFKTEDNQYLVNEMQCIFGQSDPYQMLVDGKAGRFVHDENKWIFEEGDFCTNQCYDLRLDYVIEKLNGELDRKNSGK